MKINFKESKKANPYPLSALGENKIYGYVLYFSNKKYFSVVSIPMHETLLAYSSLDNRRGMKRRIK